MSLIIYTNKDDIWLEKIKEYAEFNNWSLSKAIRQILKVFVEVNMGESKSVYENVEMPKVITVPINNRPIILEPELIGDKPDKGYLLIDNERSIDEATIIMELRPEPPKIDYITFEAQNMAKLNVNQNMESCIKEKTNDKGEINCYFFDQGRPYHPYCIKECWTNKNIWKERVRL